MINISDSANRVLNIIKAKYGLRGKSDAINVLAKEYDELILEPELRPEVLEELKTIKKNGKFRKVKKINELFE